MVILSGSRAMGGSMTLSGARAADHDDRDRATEMQQGTGRHWTGHWRLRTAALPLSRGALSFWACGLASTGAGCSVCAVCAGVCQ